MDPTSRRNGAPRPFGRLCPPAHPAPRGRGRPLRPVDDRGAGAARLQAQSRHALSHAARHGEQGLSDLTRGEGGPQRAATLPRHSAGPESARSCQREAPRAVLRTGAGILKSGARSVLIFRASAVVVAFSTTCGTQALAVDLKAQGPWIYSVPNDHGAEPEERVVMARAQNSEDVWLVLACARQAPAHIAIINKPGLSVPITGPVNVRLTFGEDAGFNLRADPIGEMSLFLRSS